MIFNVSLVVFVVHQMVTALQWRQLVLRRRNNNNNNNLVDMAVEDTLTTITTITKIRSPKGDFFCDSAFQKTFKRYSILGGYYSNGVEDTIIIKHFFIFL